MACPSSGRQSIKACGAKLHYLPPYSPDFNPIENAFAKLKSHIRKSAARTLDALERATANALPQFKPDQCANFFALAGYRSH
ncbi:transposase [Rhodopseudomonas sp. P2A-2r]|uniref:transposase n=1 Tax=Rhodopseudomonas sp. P2A-2r TaxID=2991972 RepID=UPI0039B6EDD4